MRRAIWLGSGVMMHRHTPASESAPTNEGCTITKWSGQWGPTHVLKHRTIPEGFSGDFTKIGMLFDRRQGSLALFKNGIRLGTPVVKGISGDLCWFIACRKGERAYTVTMTDVPVPGSVRDLDGRIADVEEDIRELEKKPKYLKYRPGAPRDERFGPFTYGEPPAPTR